MFLTVSRIFVLKVRHGVVGIFVLLNNKGARAAKKTVKVVNMSSDCFFISTLVSDYFFFHTGFLCFHNGGKVSSGGQLLSSEGGSASSS